MAADIAYFKRCIKEDPSYEVKHAIVDYLSGDLDEAIEVANQIIDECFNDPDGKLLTDDGVYDLVEFMSPLDAFDMGRYSDDIVAGRYYRIDGYGHFEEVEPWDYVKGILYDGYEHIVDGEVDISDELQEIIDLFNEDEDDDDYRSNNRKKAPAKKPASKAGAKKPAKSQCIKRTGTSKAKAPAKKTTQSNNRKPRKAPAKKPAVRRR